MSDARRTLPLRRIVVGAFVLSWQNRVTVMRAAGLPMLVIVVAQLAWNSAIFGSSRFADAALWCVFVAAFAWLAIATHRLVLIHGWSHRDTIEEFSLRRFAWFVGALLFLWAAAAIAIVLTMTLVMMSTVGPSYVPAGEAPPAGPSQEHFDWMQNLATAAACVLLSRISLVLPSIAMDRRPNLVEVWRFSTGNSWRLAVIVGALPWALNAITNLLWRNGATTFEVACLAVLTGVFAIIGFVALSLAYFELTHESAPLPTHPPG